jgi:NAD(P)-dependent dehydrogenase (short-subunit alcohol dehydrogenase family)
MGSLEGKVAFITGAARGQGRSHAVRLAEEGADIIAADVCAQIESVPYPLATPEDLVEMVRQVEALGRGIVAHQVDVRDRGGIERCVKDGVSELGRIDIVVANAGIAPQSLIPHNEDIAFDDTVAVNLTGERNTVQAAVPYPIEQGTGGSIVLTSSTRGLSGGGCTGNGAGDGADGYAPWPTRRPRKRARSWIV